MSALVWFENQIWNINQSSLLPGGRHTFLFPVLKFKRRRRRRRGYKWTVFLTPLGQSDCQSSEGTRSITLCWFMSAISSILTQNKGREAFSLHLEQTRNKSESGHDPSAAKGQRSLKQESRVLSKMQVKVSGLQALIWQNIRGVRAKTWKRRRSSDPDSCWVKTLSSSEA